MNPSFLKMLCHFLLQISFLPSVFALVLVDNRFKFKIVFLFWNHSFHSKMNQHAHCTYAYLLCTPTVLKHQDYYFPIFRKIEHKSQICKVCIKFIFFSSLCVYRMYSTYVLHLLEEAEVITFGFSGKLSLKVRKW